MYSEAPFVRAFAGERAPRVTDRAMEAVFFRIQHSDQPSPANRRDSLHAPSKDGDERGDYPCHVAESSLYTKASLHPLLAGTIVFGAGLAAWLRAAAQGRAGRAGQTRFSCMTRTAGNFFPFAGRDK